VYASWANLLAAIGEEETPAVVLVQGDGTSNPVTIPPGNWMIPGRYTMFVGALGTADTDVVPRFGPDAGAIVTFQGILAFQALGIGTNGGYFRSSETAAAVLLNVGTDLASTPGGSTFVVEQEMFFLLTAGAAVLGQAGGPYAIDVQAAGFTVLLATTGTVYDDCVGGAGTAVIIQGPYADFGGDPPGSYGRVQPVANLFWQSAAPAAIHSYEPNPTDWAPVPPTDVQDAITRLVQRQVPSAYFWSTLQPAAAPFALPCSGDSAAVLTIADRLAFHIMPKAGQLRSVTITPTFAGGPTQVDAYVNGAVVASVNGNLNAMAATTFVFALGSVPLAASDNLSIEVVPSAAVGDVVGSTVIDFDDLGEA
jgi:hypothetical protein